MQKQPFSIFNPVYDSRTMLRKFEKSFLLSFISLAIYLVILLLQQSSTGKEYHEKIFTLCREVMNLVQVNNKFRKLFN